MAGGAITTLAPAIVLAVTATSADSTYPTPSAGQAHRATGRVSAWQHFGVKTQLTVAYLGEVSLQRALPAGLKLVPSISFSLAPQARP